MTKTGLVSVTFRTLAVERVIELVSQAGLNSIEWGGDIHVPPTNPSWAKEVGKMTRESGLEVSSYGSYYRAGSLSDGQSFESILDAAVALGAPSIRVWAGNQGSSLNIMVDAYRFVCFC